MDNQWIEREVVCRSFGVGEGVSSDWVKRGTRLCIPRRSGKQASCSQERLCKGDALSHSNSDAEEHCKFLWPAAMALARLREVEWDTLSSRWRASFVVERVLAPCVSYSSILVVECAPRAERMRMSDVSFLQAVFLAHLLLVC
jgi:hypothetical protein